MAVLAEAYLVCVVVTEEMGLAEHWEFIVSLLIYFLVKLNPEKS